jgi:DNA-binding MarR family transcriptional regulator
MDAPAPSPCTCFRLRKLARLVTQRYDRELASAGLTLNQYSILRRAARTPQSIGALARELGMDRTTLTRDLRPLVASGCVVLVPGADARQRQVQVTAVGKAMTAAAQPSWRRAQDAVERQLGTAVVEQLHRQLDDVIQHFETDAAA